MSEVVALFENFCEWDFPHTQFLVEFLKNPRGFFHLSAFRGHVHGVYVLTTRHGCQKRVVVLEEIFPFFAVILFTYIPGAVVRPGKSADFLIFLLHSLSPVVHLIT